MSSLKQKLELLIRMGGGKLSKGEQAQAEDIWDALHRYGKLTRFQAAWVDKRYFDHRLDRPEVRQQANKPMAKLNVGYIEDASFTEPVRVATLLEFEQKCPHIAKGSPLWSRASAFLRDAGHVIELRPPKTPAKPTG